ncbi:MAG: sigma-54 interaction domain-containing protein [Clostridia bacterium]
MLAIARINTSGEVFWCSTNWPYLTGISFLKTIGSKAVDLLPGYQPHSSHHAQKVRLLGRFMYLYTFELSDSQVLIIEDRTAPRGEGGLRTELSNWQYDLPSPEMKKIRKIIDKVAQTDATVLIHGETGVGKEGVAQLIHQTSGRKEQPFVKLNCGAIAETLIESELFGYAAGAFTGAERTGKKGVFEEADGGTLFLDEIGEMPLTSQVKLLRVLQEGTFKKVGDPRPVQVDVRIIAATNRNLEEEVANGRFREDLFYRLFVLPIMIPPLRERPEDMYPLIQFFLNKFVTKYGEEKTISAEAASALLAYPWPGNVRQLENLMERLVLISEDAEIAFSDLPAAIRDHAGKDDKEQANGQTSDRKMPIEIHQILPLKEATAIVEKELLLMARKVSGSTYEIAAMLGVDQSTISRKFKQILE